MISKSEHLIASLISVVILLVALLYLHNFTYQKASQNLEGLPINSLDIKKTGNVFPHTALQNPKLLPIYGASEMYFEKSPFMSTDFFSDYHAGFDVFNMAFSGADSLIEAEEIAALGNAINGKKIVISFTPKQFFLSPNPYDVEGLYSNLHAKELVFSNYLSFSTKELAASRMIHYPKTLEKDPTLGLTIKNLGERNTLSKYIYYLIYPYEKLALWVTNRQDEARTLDYLDTKDTKSSSTQNAPSDLLKLTFDQLLAKATEEQKKATSGNNLGVGNDFIKLHPNDLIQKPFGSDDYNFLNNLKASGEHEDFVLLLSILKDLNAKPLLLGRPIKEQLYNNMGVSTDAQNQYYMKINNIVKPFGFELQDFHQYSKDLYFGTDIAPHTGAVGWVYINQILDRFYHE